MKALAKDPNDRFETAAEFATAIRRSARDQRRLFPTWLLVASCVLAIIIAAMLYAARPDETTPRPVVKPSVEPVVFTPAVHQVLAVNGRTYIGEFSQGLSRLANTRIAVMAGQTITVTPMTTWNAGPRKDAVTGGELLVAAIGESDSPPREWHIVGESVQFIAKESGFVFLGTNDHSVDDNYGDLLVELKASNPKGASAMSSSQTESQIETRIIGREFPNKTYVRDDAPPGGVLVGLNVTLGPFRGFKAYTVVSSVQPIYDVGGQLTTGRIIGTVTGEIIELRARDGFAVGAIEINQGIDNLRLTYMKRREFDLDTHDQYQSEWVRPSTRKTGRLLGGMGLPVIGIRANFGAPPSQEKYVNAIGLVQRALPSTVDTPFIGYRDFGLVERDVAPKDAWLVGLRVKLGTKGPTQTINLVQPIYRRGDTIMDGQVLVDGEGESFTVLARQGYAIGAIEVHVESYGEKSAAIKGIRPVFMRIENGDLVEAGSYDGEWLGTASEVAGSRLNCGGRACVGVVTIEHEGVLRAIALTVRNSE